MKASTLHETVAAALAVAFLVFGRAPAAETAPADSSVWSRFAGMAKELDAERLELRDELISAHFDYLSALELAVEEIGTMPPASPLLPLAWTRVEFLLESGYRLLESTGEHESFLKATERLRGEGGPAPGAADAALPDDASPDARGGLTYVDSRGGRLIPALIDGRLRLVRTGTIEAVPENEPIRAFPEEERIRADGASMHLVRARAAWLRALSLERLGRIDQAADEAGGLGLIRDWLILGPLEGDSESASDAMYGLEEVYAGLAADRVYQGKAGPVAWKPFSTLDSMGRIFPGALFRGGGSRAVHMLALVHSDANQEAVLRFGSNAPVTVRVNHFQGTLAGFADLPDLDQEAFDVWLRKGWNVILVHTSSSSDNWGLAVRLTRPDGTPFPGKTAVPTAENMEDMLAAAKKAAAGSVFERLYRPPVPASRGGLTVLSEWIGKNPDDSRANFYLASFLASKRLMEGPRRFDREMIFRKAVELSGNNPFFCLMAARAVDPGVDGPNREENLRLVLLKAAADQGSAAAMVDIGRLYLDVMRQPRRADEYADLALAANPMSLRAGVLDYDVAAAMGWRPVAKQLLERLVTRHPSAAAARLRQGRAALAGGGHRRALTEFHAILGIDATNMEALDGAVVAMGMLGQTSAAVELLSRHILEFPYDSAARLKLAELNRTLERDGDALAVIDEALAMAPDDAAMLAMRADIEREANAIGGAGAETEAPRGRVGQELDLSPPRTQPPGGWEYLYFQVEDRLGREGSIDRSVSFAIRVYSARAAQRLRHLRFGLEKDLENGAITRLELIQPGGTRETLNPPGAPGALLQFPIPPLRPGAIIEARVEIRRSPLPFLGDYFGQIASMAQEAPIRLSRYIFVSPMDRALFFRAVNGAPKAMVVESPDGGEVTRVWEMNNVAAFKPEPFSPGRQQLVPCVQISSFGDWDDFAVWYWRLIGGQYHTPPELRELAGNVADRNDPPMVSLDRAAEWVARNIGPRPWASGPYAFRPINARAILSRLSADGKDRTLFLCLLAREYGLRAWPVLARMRNRQFPPLGTEDLGLPLLDHFNHSLVMVESTPGGNVFLDASNPYRPPGVMPSQLFGGQGMAIMPGAAERVLVPDGGVAACQWEEASEIVVDDDGSILWEQRIAGAGIAAEALRERFGDRDAAADAWAGLLTSIGAVASASAADFGEDPSAPASAFFSARARLRRYAAMEEGRIVLAVPPLPGPADPSDGRFGYPLSLDEMAVEGTREQDLALPHGFRVVRRIRVSFPEEWRLANAPVPRRAEYGFGSHSLAVSLSPGRLVLEFACEIPGHRVAAGNFPEFREMAAEASRWLRPMLVWERPL